MTSSGDSNAETLDRIQILSLCWEWKAFVRFLSSPTSLRWKTGPITATRPHKAASRQPVGGSSTPKSLLPGKPLELLPQSWIKT